MISVLNEQVLIFNGSDISSILMNSDLKLMSTISGFWWVAWFWLSPALPVFSSAVVSPF